MGILEEIKQSFKEGSYLIKLIYINFSVFLLVNLIVLFFYLFTGQDGYTLPFINYLSVPASFALLAKMPWTLITYMFLHVDFFHILFNMIALYWFGKIFLEFIDQKKLLSVYLLGGISGALFYSIAFNLFPAFGEVLPYSFALGASASVLAIITSISFLVPNYTVYMLFLGRVKLLHIAIVSIILDVIMIPISNSGGHLAHLGGALFGFIFISFYKKKIFFTSWLELLLEKIFSLFKRKKRMNVSYKKPMSDMEYNARKNQSQDEINRILDKISKSGYESLTRDEKEKLFKMSNKN